MSAVEPCLDTKEISNTSELINSFETEDKDSDEESFHLFLEGEGDEDITKENIDEKEGHGCDSNLEENNQTDSSEKQNDVTLESEGSGKNEEIISSKDETLKQNSTELTDTIKSSEENQIDETLPGEETFISTNNTEVSKDVSEDLSKTEETTSETIANKAEADASSENEDDILNKHVTSEELTNNVEEVDPNIEESLLNECDEIDSEDTTEKCIENDPESSSVTVSEVKETEVTESVVEEKSDETVHMMENSGIECKENMEGPKNIEENIVSVNHSQKCDDNSNSSSPDTEDLLDISMIKDSAQDDADIAEDAFQLEQENDDSGSKCIENVDNVDDSSNTENSDDEGKEESEKFENVLNELSDSEKEKDVQESDKEETVNNSDEMQCENVEVDGDNAGVVDSVSSQDIEIDKASKRNLSNSDIEPASKRIKLVDTDINDAEIESSDITELQNLISFSQFMTKSHMKKLTRSDLEEFCIQKLCEAILHKSELGETNHQLKILEKTIESLRRDQTVLTKQIKDLEIVNKKLMHEILSSNGTKPILPVKITRSVGLQVRLPLANDCSAAKRRSLPTAQPKTPIVQNQVGASKVRTTNTIPIRPLTQPSPQKQTTPILNQALQNRNRTPVKTPQLHNNTLQRPNISPKVIPEKRARTSGSFIDLTDEDDRRANSKNVNNKNLKSMVPQGVRINSIPKTTVSSVLPSVVSTTTPQLMYVVQPNSHSQIKQGVLTTHGQKAVLVNFQPTNGVLNNLNSSSVSVIPKVAATVPIKAKPSPQNSLLKVAKHPAPLPNPPAIQGPTDKSLKAIPPKPVVSFRKTNTGIILQWRMPYDLGNYEAIASYQVYAYQETSALPSTDMWRKVGDVKAMALPMACTLAQFPDKNKYYFAVRPVDVHKRIGKFSHPVLSE